MPEAAFRVDRGALGEARLDHNGTLIVKGTLTRTGVFTYRHTDKNGKTFSTKELRHPEDVFDAKSVASFAQVPVTDDHPTEGRVTSDNVKRLSVGNLGDSISREGQKDNLVTADLIIRDAKAIDKVMGRGGQPRKLFLSCGYKADVIEDDGEYMGEKYDHRQTNIRGNHVALVRNPRAGEVARLMLDSDDAVLEDEGDAWIEMQEVVEQTITDALETVQNDDNLDAKQKDALSEKISKIAHEHPEWENDQVVAVAHKMLGISKKDNGEDGDWEEEAGEGKHLMSPSEKDKEKKKKGKKDDMEKGYGNSGMEPGNAAIPLCKNCQVAPPPGAKYCPGCGLPVHTDAADKDGIIEDVGEGSRGGHIIGHTSSGKPVYSAHGHKSHEEFSAKDHYEAAGLHEKTVHAKNKQHDQTNTLAAHSTPKKSESTHKKLKKIIEVRNLHSEQNHKHLGSWVKMGGLAVTHPHIQDSSVKICEDAEGGSGVLIDERNATDEGDEDINDMGGGPGSRGGNVIGKTSSGKPIYASHGHSAHKGFDPKEHKEAAKAHEGLFEKHSKESDRHYAADRNLKGLEELEKSKHHYIQFVDHHKSAGSKVDPKTAKFEDSDEDLNSNPQTRGDNVPIKIKRGPVTIGSGDNELHLDELVVEVDNDSEEPLEALLTQRDELIQYGQGLHDQLDEAKGEAAGWKAKADEATDDPDKLEALTQEREEIMDVATSMGFKRDDLRSMRNDEIKCKVVEKRLGTAFKADDENGGDPKFIEGVWSTIKADAEKVQDNKKKHDNLHRNANPHREDNKNAAPDVGDDDIPKLSYREAALLKRDGIGEMSEADLRERGYS